MSTKYIFLDIDGTLVDFNCTMPKSCEAALRAAWIDIKKPAAYVASCFDWSFSL